jgi:hypothetical protein
LLTLQRIVPRFRVPDPLADPHAALGGARDHLVQYLAWRKDPDPKKLTARAYTPELEAATKRIAAGSDDPRIARLAGLAPRPTRWRRLALASVVLAGVGMLGTAVVQAIRYHGTYTETMHGKAK